MKSWQGMELHHRSTQADVVEHIVHAPAHHTEEHTSGRLRRTVAAVLAVDEHEGAGLRQLREERPVGLLHHRRQQPPRHAAGRHLQVRDPIRGDHDVMTPVPPLELAATVAGLDQAGDVQRVSALANGEGGFPAAQVDAAAVPQLLGKLRISRCVFPLSISPSGSLPLAPSCEAHRTVQHRAVPQTCCNQSVQGTARDKEKDRERQGQQGIKIQTKEEKGWKGGSAMRVQLAERTEQQNYKQRPRATSRKREMNNEANKKPSGSATSVAGRKRQ